MVMKCIIIPLHIVQELVCALTGCHSDQEEQLWVWEYEAEDGKHDMFMDIEEEIRFRVVQETFVDTSPSSGRQHTGCRSSVYGKCQHKFYKTAYGLHTPLL